MPVCASGLQAGPVKVSSLEDFLADHPYTIREYKTRTYSREECVERARARIGEDLYHPAFQQLRALRGLVHYRHGRRRDCSSRNCTKPMPTGWQEQRPVRWSANIRWTRFGWRHVASTAPTSSGRRSFARGGADFLNPAALGLFLLDHLAAQPDLLGELGSARRIVRRHHRIVGGQAPLLSVALRRHCRTSSADAASAFSTSCRPLGR